MNKKWWIGILHKANSSAQVPHKLQRNDKDFFLAFLLDEDFTLQLPCIILSFLKASVIFLRMSPTCLTLNLVFQGALTGNAWIMGLGPSRAITPIASPFWRRRLVWYYRSCLAALRPLSHLFKCLIKILLTLSHPCTYAKRRKPIRSSNELCAVLTA